MLAWSCSPTPESPEEQVRSLLVEAERAVEARDVRTLKGFVSERYADSSGNDRDAIVGLLTYHFLRNETIHLLTRIAAIDLPSDRRAAATAYVAMAGHAIPGSEALANLRADLYRFEFTLADEGEQNWRLTQAAWRAAEPEDFL